MEPMKPMVGMTGAYYSTKCSLRVEVVSYEELTNKEIIALKVLRNLSPNLGCRRDEGDTFLYERNKNSIDNGVDGLILDFLSKT
jgi:hypothetical protein